MMLSVVIDFVSAAALAALTVHGLRRSRAGFAALVLFALGVSLIGAHLLELTITSWILRASFAGVAVCFIVAYRHELRQAIERLAGVLSHRRVPQGGDAVVDAIVNAVQKMAADHTGALIVLPGRDALDHSLSGGVPLEGHVSEALLLSLFESHSPGHDGAVVVEADRVSRFAVHLPLSSDRVAIGDGGTRHAAALGVAERSDALCIVVSGERGEISVAHDGRLQRISADSLRPILKQRASGGKGPVTGPKPWWSRGPWWIDVAVGAAISVVVWLFVAPGVSEMNRQIEVPVKVVNVPEGYALHGLEPSHLEITITGPRASVLMARPDDFQVVIDGAAIRNGRRRFGVQREAVEHPDEVVVEQIEDHEVRVNARRESEDEPRTLPETAKPER